MNPNEYYYTVSVPIIMYILRNEYGEVKAKDIYSKAKDYQAEQQRKFNELINKYKFQDYDKSLIPWYEK